MTQTFVIRKNIERFRALLETTTDEDARQRIARLLEEETAKLSAAKPSNDER